MVFAGLKPDVTFDLDLDLFVGDETFRAVRAAGFKADHDERGLASSATTRPTPDLHGLRRPGCRRRASPRRSGTDPAGVRAASVP